VIEEQPPVRARVYLPLPAPKPVPRCSDCARHQRVIDAVDTNPTALVDARVLLARHLAEDHRPEPAPGCEQ
jgi:hypothetical protein